MRDKIFSDNAWEDYLYWQKEDKATLKKINQLIEDVCRNGYSGIGKPEPLKGDMTGYWSRRINERDRLVYRVDDDHAYFISCRYHYHK